MKKLLSTQAYPLLLCRLIAGLVFVSEGLQKFIRPAAVGAGRFEQIGFAHAAFWAGFAGIFEVICGLLIILGLLTRLAALPLLIIMATAFVTTKIPILMSKGFWPFAHEYRTDFAMTMLLLLLLLYGGGKASVDRTLSGTIKT